MKKFLLFFLLLTVSKAAFADLVNTPTGSPVSDVMLLVGVIAVASLLVVRYRRTRSRR
jgi:hypothetical protein